MTATGQRVTVARLSLSEAYNEVNNVWQAANELLSGLALLEPIHLLVFSSEKEDMEIREFLSYLDYRGSWEICYGKQVDQKSIDLIPIRNASLRTRIHCLDHLGDFLDSVATRIEQERMSLEESIGYAKSWLPNYGG